MNSQNLEQQNSSWRQPSYLQESRNQPAPRPETFYPQYPSSQIPNDYLPSSYVYPGIMPPFRHPEFNLSPINDEWNHSFGLMPSETYSKFYNKPDSFNIQNQQYLPKNYPHPNNFFDKPPDFRPQSHYDESQLRQLQTLQTLQSSLNASQGYPNEESLRIQKTNKSKNVIVIESDEEDHNNQVVFDGVKSAPQQVQEKPIKQLSRGNQIQLKKSDFIIEIPPESKLNQTIPQVSPIILDNILDSQQKPSRSKDKQPKFYQSDYGIFTDMPSFKLPISQFVPMRVVAHHHQNLMQEIEEAQIPDITTKLFLKYKIKETLSLYQETEEASFHVLNNIKIYATILLFEKERKKFLEKVFSEQILAVTNRPCLFNGFSSKNEGTFYDLYKKNDQNFIIRIQPEDTKEKHKSANRYRQLSRSDYPRNPYQPKTKKISKKQSSDPNSQQVSFNARNKYLEKYDLEPSQLICDRKLRQRKKKKNRKDRSEKSLDPRYGKEKPGQRENSKNDKQPHEKEQSKKNSQLSQDYDGMIQKIKNWADKTVLADAIQQKHKKSFEKEKPKNSLKDNYSKNDPFKVIKKEDQTKKYKQRWTKSSEAAFRQELAQKMQDAKGNKQTLTPNLITFATSNNLSEVEKEEYQKELNHLIKEMKNNDSHGKIRIGKEYFQAKMPNFIRSENELKMVIKEKRERLMERKMTVLTF